MAEEKGYAREFELTEAAERVGVPLLVERLGRTLPMCANMDLYSGLVYKMLGIPEEHYTPPPATPVRIPMMLRTAIPKPPTLTPR